MRDDSLGIYCVQDKKFFYLETGKVYVANTVDRLKKALVKRGLIEFTDKTFLSTEAYKVITCRDAKLESYEMIPIYISKHVRNTMEDEQVNKAERTGWAHKS